MATLDFLNLFVRHSLLVTLVCVVFSFFSHPSSPTPTLYPVLSFLPSMLPVLKVQTRGILLSRFSFYFPLHPQLQLQPQTNDSQVCSTALGYFAAGGPFCTLLQEHVQTALLNHPFSKPTFLSLSVDLPPMSAQFQRPRLWDSSPTPHSLSSCISNLSLPY